MNELQSLRAGREAGRTAPESSVSAEPREATFASRARRVAYWLLTLFIAYEMAAGALWDLLGIEYVRVVITHLGYPLYFLTIIGAWKLPCAMALLAPGLPRLKEWAYAGAFFNYTGAFESHLLAGDRAALWTGPLVFALFTMASRVLLPPERRVPRHGAGRSSLAAWGVPAAIVLALVALALATLPKGAPPL
jgi:hypothetical protein